MTSPAQQGNLLPAIAAGDTVAVADLYDRHGATIYALLLKVLGDHPDAQEVLHDCFVQAWRNAAAFDPARGSEIAWLVSIARDAAIDRLRVRAVSGGDEGRELSGAVSATDRGDEVGRQAAPEELESLEATAALALALPPVAPRRDARDTLLRQIESEAVAQSLVAEATETAAAAERRAVPSWWFAAAAIFFLALFGWSELRLRALREELHLLQTENEGLTAENMRLEADARATREKLVAIRSTDRLFQLEGATGPDAGVARVFIDSAQRRATVVVENLAPNDAAHSYQLWIHRGDKVPPVSAGTFDVEAGGRAAFEVRDFPVDTPLTGIFVTLEPRGGQPAPSGNVLLRGKA